MKDQELQELLKSLQRPTTREWIANLIREWAENDASIHMMIQLGHSKDRHLDAEELIQKEGSTTETKDGTLKTHPAVRISQTAMENYRKIIKFLGIEVDTIIQGEGNNEQV